MAGIDRHEEDRMARREQTIACTLTGGDLAAQAERWRRLRNRAGIARVEVADGLRLAFGDESGVEGALQALIAVENECCPWARWEVLREGDRLIMQATSSGAGVATLHSMFVQVEHVDGLDP